MIASVGLMRLADILDGGESERYRAAAHRLLDAQIGAAFDPAPEGVQGLLPKVTYNAAEPDYVEQYTLFGDYFFLEALARQVGYNVVFWDK